MPSFRFAPGPTLGTGLLGLILLASGCSVGLDESPSPTYQRTDFFVSPTPPSLEIPAGGSGYVTVLAGRFKGFQEAISLSLEGLPAGVEASGTIPAGQYSGRLTVTVARGAAPATLGSLILQGAAGGLKRTAAFSLTVLPPLPAPSLPTSQAQVAGGAQGSGNLRNQALALEPVTATRAASPDGRLEVRHGFLPTSQPLDP